MEEENFKKRPSRNTVLIGLLLVAAGILIFVNKTGILFLPYWFFTWPVFIIGLGLLIGIQHNFKSFAWLIMVIWGSYSLLNQQAPSLHLHNYSTPLVLIFIGLFFILRRKHTGLRNWNNKRWNNFQNKDVYNDDGEFIDSTSVFSGAKKVVISKNFKGADITCFMGGAEIDLSQADIQGKAIIDATAVFGGIKIIVPSNWDLKIETHAAFGNVEDKRRMQNLSTDPSRQLIIDGTAVFGGIEISNF